MTSTRESPIDPNMPVSYSFLLRGRKSSSSSIAKVKEDKKEKKEEKATPTKKSKSKGGKIDKSLISGPVRSSPRTGV
jgi:hypothetical protein